MSDQIRAQLNAIRAQLDALELLVTGESVSTGVCPHPEDKRVPAGTMGNARQFYCHECQRLIIPDAET